MLRRGAPKESPLRADQGEPRLEEATVVLCCICNRPIHWSVVHFEHSRREAQLIKAALDTYTVQVDELEEIHRLSESFASALYADALRNHPAGSKTGPTGIVGALRSDDIVGRDGDISGTGPAKGFVDGKGAIRMESYVGGNFWPRSDKRKRR